MPPGCFGPPFVHLVQFAQVLDFMLEQEADRVTENRERWRGRLRIRGWEFRASLGL